MLLNPHLNALRLPAKCELVVWTKNGMQLQPTGAEYAYWLGSLGSKPAWAATLAGATSYVYRDHAG